MFFSVVVYFGILHAFYMLMNRNPKNQDRTMTRLEIQHLAVSLERTLKNFDDSECAYVYTDGTYLVNSKGRQPNNTIAISRLSFQACSEDDIFNSLNYHINGEN